MYYSNESLRELTPICNNALLDRVLEGENIPLCLGLTATLGQGCCHFRERVGSPNVEIFEIHSYHGACLIMTSDDRSIG